MTPAETTEAKLKLWPDLVRVLDSLTHRFLAICPDADGNIHANDKARVERAAALLAKAKGLE